MSWRYSAGAVCGENFKWTVSITIYISIIHTCQNFLQLGLALLAAFQVRVGESNGSSNSVKGKAIGLGRKLERGKVELCQLITR